MEARLYKVCMSMLFEFKVAFLYVKARGSDSFREEFKPS